MDAPLSVWMRTCRMSLLVNLVWASDVDEQDSHWEFSPPS